LPHFFLEDRRAQNLIFKSLFLFQKGKIPIKVQQFELIKKLSKINPRFLIFDVESFIKKNTSQGAGTNLNLIIIQEISCDINIVKS